MQKAIEKELIRRAYLTTLNPEELTSFEEQWEYFLDENPDATKDSVQNQDIQSHLNLAMEVVERLVVEVDDFETARDLVNKHVGACAIVNQKGQILAYNDEGKDFFKGSSSLTTTDFYPEDIEKLKAWLKAKANTKTTEHQFFCLQTKDDTEPKHYFVSSLDGLDKHNDRHYIIACAEIGASQNAYLVIKKTFNLSHAETDISIMISNGLTPQQIADQRNVSILTVRSQIKQILAKTNARNMHNLSRILIGMSVKYREVAADTNQQYAVSDLSNFTKRFSFILNDGRSMEVTEQGRSSGAAVLRFHSLVSGVQMIEKSAQLADAQNIRIIAPSRAGFGNSEPLTKLSLEDHINQSLEDYIYILDHLKIDKVVLMCERAGFLAQRFALKYPERTLGLLMIGTVPIWEDSHLDSLRPRHKVLIKTSMHAPYAVPYLARMAKVLIDAGKTGLYISGIDQPRKTEKAVLEKRENFESIERMYKHIANQGVQAFVRELPTIHTDWSDDAKKLTCPINIVLGSHIKNQPRSAVEAYLKSAPHANTQIIKGAGIFLLTTHFEDVATTLRQMASV